MNEWFKICLVVDAVFAFDQKKKGTTVAVPFFFMLVAKIIF